MNYKVAIIGKGHVGSCMLELFPDAYVYDEPLGIGTREEANTCDIAFVCVPTPKGTDGVCDTSIVRDVLEWLDTDVIVLRSTVPVGFTDVMKYELNKSIVFQPEYYGETTAHPFADPHNRNWITLGGYEVDVTKVVELYQSVFTSEIIINIVSPTVAEMAKYMENSFFATKVIFCNQFYDLCLAMDVDYNQVRETWLLDPRIGRSHTFVYPDNQGYGGACLPKDTAAIIHQGDEYYTDMSLLKAVEKINGGYHND